MKKIFVLAAGLLMPLFMSADGSVQEKYIEKYAPVAVAEMHRSGVPASITLAQGLLESGFGKSALAVKGNNHFGIKCHNDWKGSRMYHDDDAKGECFRVYADAAESFRDHSDFLRYRDRYKFLFDYDITDYKAWAHGLKKAGYATDPAYPSKLIKYIEEYNLSRFDTGKFDVRESETVEEPVQEQEPSIKEKDDKSASKAKPAKQPKPKKARKVKKEPESKTLPASPNVIEEPVRYMPEKGEVSFSFNLSREVLSNNGVPFVYSVEGETYSSIAESYNLFLKEILRFNDLDSEEKLLPGTRVYIKAKKDRTSKDMRLYIVEHDRESMRDISQRFGLKLKSLMKMNSFSEGHVLREGDSIILYPSDRK